MIAGRAEDIPDCLRFDQNGDLFCRYDSGVGKKDRCVIFFSKFKEEFIQKVEFVLIDGTFRSTPHGFCQILVVHGLLLENSILYHTFY
jgi:hypothetical protein